MLRITNSGNLKKTRDFLHRAKNRDIYRDLARYGERGVDALSSATPINSGLTANSWAYRLVNTKGRVGIEWYNTNMAGVAPVAILLQYGHGTGTGGFVMGRDYINPAIKPIFDQIAEDVWKKVRA